ncbi:D-Ala-D-Ala carboxypeptidase family metallohydrolase [Sulfurimonas sp. NWX367]|uniref:D-Ala-D-Ala carboxypeptidase family metallohydrolase n=1 Tax=Sulfurimonas sp. NWX367 TaxID=2925413 RepID=UPI0032046CD3
MRIMKKIKYFTSDEISCPCCGFMNINTTSLYKLDLLRESLGLPLIVNSACRCKFHNEKVGGSSNSSHLCSMDRESFAFDIKVTDDSMRFQFLRKAIDLGFHRIGIYSNFIHLDDDMRKRPCVWYGK